MSEKFESTSCEAFEVLISCGLDDELSSEEQAALSSHLARCSSCRSRQLQFEGLNGMMREQVRVPEIFPAGRLRISAGGPHEASEQSRNSRFRAKRNAAYGAVAAAAVVVFLLLSLNFNFSDTPDTAEILAPMVSLAEINSQRIEDQKFLRDSLELDLRTLKLQLATLDAVDGSATLLARIDGLMKRIEEFESQAVEN